MKRLIRIVPLLLAMLLESASAADPVLSVVTNDPPTAGDVTVKVTVKTTDTATNVGFRYTRQPNGVEAKTPTTLVVINQVVVVDELLQDLVGGQSYTVKAQALSLTGALQVETATQTISVPAYAGKPTTVTATTKAATAILNGTVTANGTPGKVHFEYGVFALPPTYGSIAEPDKPIVLKGDIDRAVQAKIPSGLVRNKTYQFKLVFVDDATGTSVSGGDKTFLTNNPPVANTDTVNVSGSAPITIRPLDNDSDPDGDKFSLVDLATKPENGTAKVVGATIIYTPGPNPQAFDDFTYTIMDEFKLTATGTISVRSPGAAFSGTHGGFVKRANGKEAGYFQVNATSLGTFTGTATIEGKRYVLNGSISPDGDYTGSATDGKSVLPVSLSIDQTDTDSVVKASFDNGRWTSDVTLAPAEASTRAEAAGRYTVELPGGTAAGTGTESVVTPEGTGWAALKVNEDGTAKIKGRLSDGRSFSSRGTVVTEDDGAVVTFFESLEDTRVVGSFSLGDTVSGSLHVDRTSSDDQHFPDGYDVSQSVSGARYTPPENGQRALDSGGTSTKELTITFSGGDLSGDLVRHLRLDDDDDVTVTDRGSEQLKVSIDRKSGRFKAAVTIDTDGTRVKGNGVLIQETGTTTTASGGRGAGVFNGSAQTGRIEIAPGTATPPTSAAP